MDDEVASGLMRISRTGMGIALRLGLLPGSFDPPHRGHLQLAERAREVMGLDRVYFYPNSLNANKPGLSSLHHRRSMVDLTVDHCTMLLMPEETCDIAPVPDPDHDFMGEIARLRTHIGVASEIVMVRGSDYFHPSLVHRYPVALRAFPHVIGFRDHGHRGYDFSALPNVAFVECNALSSTEVRSHCRRSSAWPEDAGPLERYWRRHGLYV